jgi:hypothetical protein
MSKGSKDIAYVIRMQRLSRIQAKNARTELEYFAALQRLDQAREFERELLASSGNVGGRRVC